ncbi:hypothetical protein [Streptomyces sp. S186]|uniref:hypothetical protein n=1 Tax=Streptomyces sp. S186 TaxID=3434395 RepID=UPI003F66A924
MERLREGALAVSDLFEVPLRQLDAAQRRMFGLLGLVLSEDIDAHGAITDRLSRACAHPPAPDGTSRSSS